MSNTASTQEELERNQVSAHYFERAKQLMQEAADDGVVLRLNMHSAIEKDAFSSNNSVVAAPFAGKGKTLLFVENNAKGPYDA